MPTPVFVDTRDRRALRAALLEADQQEFRRGYSLAQIRQIRAVRDLVAPIDLDAINFDTGSAAIRPSEARDLIELGELMLDLIDENPGEVFLIEGHHRRNRWCPRSIWPCRIAVQNLSRWP